MILIERFVALATSEKLRKIIYSTSLANRPHLEKVIRNSGWLLFDAIVRGASTFLVVAWVARYLGPTEFGELSYVIAYLGFFQVVANLGMDTIVVREIAKLPPNSNKSFKKSPQNSLIVINNSKSQLSSKIGETLGAAFTLRLIVGTISWIVAVGGMVVLYGWGSKNVLLTALAGSCLVFQAANTIDLWFQSQNQSWRTVMVRFAAFLISNGLRIIFILAKLPLVFFAVAIFIEFLVTAVALSYAYKQFSCGSAWVLKIKNIGLELFKESLPFILSGLSIAIYMRIDQVMVRNMLGDEVLGIYSSALALTSLWYVIPSIICTSVLPTITLIKSRDHKLFLKQIVRIFRILIAISISVSGIVLWQSDNLVYFFYGNKYSLGSDILKILIFTTIPVFIGVGQSIWITNEKKSKLFLMQTLAGAFASVGLNILLIPIYGLTGAAIGLLVSELISVFLISAVFEKKLFLMQIGFLPSKLYK